MPDDSLPSRRRIVVGVDGSAGSVGALHWAAQLAPSVGAELDAVTCWAYPVSYGMSVAPPPAWDPAADANEILATALTAAFGEHRPDGLRAVVSQGHPAEVLLEASEDAELLVVGSRGHGGFAGLLLGSVSAHCAEHASCPVLVTRTEPRPQAGPQSVTG
jgi:nucleotide-binding universal stress UspA family protein